MKWKDMLFPSISAIIPLVVNEIINHLFYTAFLKEHQKMLILILSGVLSIFILMLISSALEQYFLELNKYSGQWVEEMICLGKQEEGNPKENTEHIGIGIIQYDHTTKEHTFIGKTYSLQGKEEYAWNIDYLRAEKDNAMQYICGVQNPNQMSIGRLTFSSPNACEGVIWVMDGTTYKFNAYRITPTLVEELRCRQLKSSLFKHFSKKRVILDPKEYNLFAIKYAQKMHFEKYNMQILYGSVDKNI